MAWIRSWGKDEASGELDRIYSRIAPAGEPVDHILTIHSQHPRSLEGHWTLYRTLMYGPGPLSRREREVIAVAVSAANRCHY